MTIATPYQHALAGIAGGLAAPRGSEIEWVQLQLFFPFDLGVFVALCLATSWATWRERGRAIALGVPILIVLEVTALVFAMKAMLGTLAPGTPPARVEEVQRWALGIIRVTGPSAAGACGWDFSAGSACFQRSPHRSSERRNADGGTHESRAANGGRSSRAGRAPESRLEDDDDGGPRTGGRGARALPLLRGNQPKSDRAKFSVVEANRFLLRDVHGAVVGGLESTPDGTLRLVLGQRGGASAHIVVQPHESQLTLNAPDGQWRAVLAGSNQPSLSLSPDGRAANAALLTRDDGTGSVLLRDALGRPRFRAP